MSKNDEYHESNVGFVDSFALCCKERFRKAEKMELAILTVVLLVAASQIPGDYHVVFFR